MGFKSDREFLRNISIGATGTRQVATVLTRGGFNIIELERYCFSNKIWTTKIKRLRVPDLLCLRTGIRIESRAKSTLEVTMSHAVNNPDRAWDKGLRDHDLIALVRCSPEGDGWIARERVALFRVGDMRATAGSAGLSRIKSASEGSEVRLTWPAIVPRTSGIVTAVAGDKVDTLLSNGRKQSYRLERQEKGALTAYVEVGDAFGDGDTIIASIVPTLIPPIVPKWPPYDFLADLENDSPETVYVAVKALGLLPGVRSESAHLLDRIMRSQKDERVRLEAAASLARLQLDDGWNYLTNLARQADAPKEYRMEVALILAEIPDSRAKSLLAELAENRANASELRAAGAWGLAAASDSRSQLLGLTDDADETVAVHAIVGASRTIKIEDVPAIVQSISDEDRRAAGIVRTLLASRCDFVSEAVRQAQQAPPGKRRQWLLYLLAAKGRGTCAPYVQSHAPELLAELDFFWSHHAENWTNRLDVADQIDFLEQQSP